jgi:Acetyltransferase (GNAT) domain
VGSAPLPSASESLVLTFEADDFERWWHYYHRLEQKGIYHQPDYIRLLETYYYKDAQAELFVFIQGDDFVYYPYFKRKIPSAGTNQSNHALNGYWDIISSWYYGGPLVSKYSSALVQAFRRSFESHCKSNGIVSEFIRFDPYLENHHLVTGGNVSVKDNREVVYIDLTSEPDEIIRPYKKRFRLLKRALEHGVDVRFDDNLQHLESFYRLYISEMERKQAPNGYFFDLDFFRDLLKINKVYLMVLIKEGKCIGGDIVVGGEYLVHDYLRATDPNLWNMRINDLLIHKNIFFFKESRHRLYDLQGGRQGVIEFKRSFSNLRKPFKTGTAIHLPDMYRSFTAACPGSDETFFPAYRHRDKN